MTLFQTAFSTISLHFFSLLENPSNTMNRKFRNNHRGDWNDMPFNDFSQEQFKNNYRIPRERSRHYAEDNKYFSHQSSAQYADEKYLPHLREKQYADERHLPRQREEHYADDRHLPHQRDEHYADEMQLRHQREKNYPNERHFPRQRVKNCPDERPLPRQWEKHCPDDRHLPRQSDELYADEMNFPRQREEHYADERHLPRQREKHCPDEKHFLRLREKHCPDKRLLPRQSKELCADQMHFPRQREEHYAEERHLPRQREKHYADERNLPCQRDKQYADDRHLQRQREERYAHERHLPHQTLEDYADKKRLPRQTLKSTISVVAPVQCPQSNNGNRHQILLEPREPSKKTSNGQESWKIPNSQINPVVPKYKKTLRSVENVSHDAPMFTYKEVPNEGSKGKRGDKTVAKSHGFKVKNGRYEAPIFKQRKVPDDERYTRKFRDYSGAMDHGLRRDISGPRVGNYTKKKIGIRRFMKSAKHDVNALSNSGSNRTESMSCDFAAQVPVTSPKLSRPPVARTSFEPRNHIDSQREVQNHGVEKNDEQHSISIEFHAPSGSDAVGSSFEPHTEIEPQESKAEKDIELQPSLLLDTDAASEVSAETETTDGSSQDEVEMDTDAASEVSAENQTTGESSQERTKLLQVSVCLTCGDVGFEETLVYCYRCEKYALHRYCLDGPVIFTDEVIWFCEDCQEKVDIDFLDSEDSEEDGGDSSDEFDAVVFPQPSAESIWKGTLKLFDKSFELMGHLSTLACPKVLEKTGHLPDVLYADLLERSTVWPESFRINNHSIGLYFFPQDESDERSFDKLVDEIISNEHAIRAKVEKVDLLIFPSTMLPSQSKRFQSKYYLWGIFNI